MAFFPCNNNNYGIKNLSYNEESGSAGYTRTYTTQGKGLGILILHYYDVQNGFISATTGVTVITPFEWMFTSHEYWGIGVYQIDSTSISFTQRGRSWHYIWIEIG